MKELSLLETQQAIKYVKDLFQENFSKSLNLYRVTAPIVLDKDMGINDNLNGIEMPVSFESATNGLKGEIPQSLAKWKRVALKRYDIPLHYGIYTDMNAIRKDEILSNIHSIYVDQWDWELHIEENERNINTLKSVVTKIYDVLKFCQKQINKKYNWDDSNNLPDNITFISSQQLLDLYPNLTPEQREQEITKKYKAVFIIGIGNNLSDNKPHGLRSPDYDDWNLNGDLIVWNYTTNSALELSSMGIRVDSKSLLKQLEITKTESRINLDYHQKIMKNEIPFSIGGGIGQSRLCYFMLHKKHIGQVQASIWPKEMKEELEKQGIILL